ncbi:hypothetical protein BVZ31_17925 [Alcaligenes faecalis]|uniref:phage tail protein n=1 Tax=Alcaligenes faecalis TaxID=511 RepID=UPI000A2DACAC|nr:phage tail protein [Alcaligenes faecalis]OSZ41369.1 hypothetical protein BVZ30_17395 [Alcaligenes faecalis]OSZ47747.1 hypothetical protein BVZ31_17925 [Alcaligenes faecalis]OSZ54165.1 hypothetical protein BVZ32_05390 [Alcaligenes faecalis]
MAIAIEAKRGGMRILGSGGGGKGGGGGARSPVEMPDSLHNTSFAAVLDAIGNGEMAGPAHTDQPLRDIYLDGTPIQNADGSLNFRSVQVDYRVGTQDQEHIAGFPAAANVTSVGAEVGTNTPWTQLLTNPDLSAVRISLHWPQLLTMVDSGDNAGDRIGTRVEYAIDLAVGSGSFVNVLTSAADGKTISGYTRTHRIDLPAGAQGWTVRVRRLTPDSSSSAVQSRMMIQSYAEVIDGKYRYPMTALVGIRVDAEQFQAIPTRAYHWRGQIIRVPSNYDPVARTYSGVWDGTFKRAWSNNPAWVFYDMLTNKLYGLGDRIDASMVDRYALYQIGAYCDQMVDDGQGGTEPRFVCNAYLQSSADALRVVNDLASVFRGMTYWANGQAVAVADMPSDPVYTYPNERVIGGRFNYIGADLTTLKTVALVSWNDPTDFYRAKVEVVTDYDGVRQHGIRKVELVAFGCTSRGQAQRVGLYHLYTSRMEQGGVSFSVGLDGVIPQPGSLIKIADQNRAGRRLGGLIAAATTTKITLDSEHPIKIGDRLTINLPSGQTQTRQVSAVAGRAVTVNPGFSVAPVAQAAWAVEADDLALQYARVISIKERDGITFDISAVEHHPGKFDAIDYGVRLEPLPVSVVPPRVQMAPTNVRIREHYVVRQGQSRHIAEITWDAVDHALFYDVQWRRDNSGWVQVPRTGARLVEIPDFYTGEYIVRVRAINGLDVPSLWAYSEATALAGQVSAPQPVTHLITASIPWGIRLSWGFPTGPNIIERTEIRYSPTQEFADSLPAGSFAYPSDSFEQTGLAITTEHFFWARLIDKNGTQGPWYPAESAPGVRGVPSQEAGEYNELITQEIVAGGLGERIMGDIEAIPSIKDTLSGIGVDMEGLRQDVDQHAVVIAEIPQIKDVLTDLGIDVTGLEDEINALQAEVADIVGAPNWDAQTQYLAGQIVKFDGSLYRAIKNVPVGTPVGNASYWEKIGDYDSLGQAVAALLVRMSNAEVSLDDLTGELIAQSQEILALQSDLSGLDGKVSGQAQLLEGLRTSVSELDGVVTSEAARTSSIIASLREDDGQGQLDGALNEWDSRAWIQRTEKAVVDNQKAQATVNERLGVQIGDNTAQIGSLSDVVATLDQSTAIKLDQLESSLGGLDGELAGQAGALDLLKTDVSRIDGAVTAQSTSISQLESGVADNKSAIQTVSQTVASEKAAQVQVNQQVQSDLAGLGGAVSGQAQALDKLETSVSEIDDAVASEAARTSSIIASLREDDGQGQLDGALNEWDSRAWIQRTEKAVVDNQKAQATVNERLGVQIGDNTAQIGSLSDVVATLDQSTAIKLDQLESSLGGLDGELAGQAGALDLLKTDVSRIDGAVTAQSTSISQLESGVADNKSAIQAVGQTVADNKSAQAQVNQQVQSSIGDVAASAQELTEAIATLDGKIASSWAVKLQGNQNGVKYVAGVGLDLTNESGITQSTFAVLADRFAVMHAVNGVPATVFSVQGGASIINSALIGNASITEAKIANAAITRAKIQDAAINAAKIESAAITSVKIQDAAITRAKIGHAEVDTLRISGNAVAIQAGASAGVRYASSGVWDLNVDVYLQYAADVTVSAAFDKSSTNYPGSAPNNPSSRILIDGNEVFVFHGELMISGEARFSASGGAISLTTRVEAGSHRFTLRQGASLYAGYGDDGSGHKFAPAGLSVICTMR